MFHAVVGAQYGDEGKGKMVDYFAVNADVVVRYQGGGNAGHTIVNEHGKFALHLVPSGIFNPETFCILGTGVVIHPAHLVRELRQLEDRGISTKRLIVSERAHLVLPYHVWQDAYEEEKRSRKVGTTLQGIGPAYQDKVGRYGIQIGEMIHLDSFRTRLEAAWAAKIERMPALADYGSFESMWAELVDAREVLLPHIADTLPFLMEAEQSQKHILLEGQLGIMRDLDWGVYPYVTSSSPITGGVFAGAGIPATAISRVTGITKAYTTAVGEGPFPTQLDNEIGQFLQDKGEEFGATTGRARKCGWLDLPALRMGAWLNGYTELALMKLDVLAGLEKIGVCVAYRWNGHTYSMPMPAYQLEDAEPIYEFYEGFSEDISNCRVYEELPKTARQFIEALEADLQIPIRYISVGPNRDQTIIRNEVVSLGK
ncbi:adenylosuccinate synthase [Alicyclobacillus tolerans]|uniref:adenylosuccinate synthase n=1 Tax=Alicyclobacillus tolerans TaxID=90970 RepID=UPI003B77E518